MPSDAMLQSARTALLGAIPELLAIYLFGSAARGDARNDSDVDLAVLGRRPLTPLRRFELQRELSVLLNRDVDLVDLLCANSILRAEVIAHGRRLHQRDADSVLDFEARSLSDYGSLLDATRALRDDIRARGRVYAR